MQIYGDIINRMQFNSLISAIPSVWRMEIKEGIEAPGPTKFEIWERKNKLTSFIYWQIISKNKPQSGTKRLWEQDLKIALCELRWFKFN